MTWPFPSTRGSSARRRYSAVVVVQRGERGGCDAADAHQQRAEHREYCKRMVAEPARHRRPAPTTRRFWRVISAPARSPMCSRSPSARSSRLDAATTSPARRRGCRAGTALPPRSRCHRSRAPRRAPILSTRCHALQRLPQARPPRSPAPGARPRPRDPPHGRAIAARRAPASRVARRRAGHPRAAFSAHPTPSRARTR